MVNGNHVDRKSHIPNPVQTLQWLGRLQHSKIVQILACSYIFEFMAKRDSLTEIMSKPMQQNACSIIERKVGRAALKPTIDDSGLMSRILRVATYKIG